MIDAFPSLSRGHRAKFIKNMIESVNFKLVISGSLTCLSEGARLSLSTLRTVPRGYKKEFLPATTLFNYQVILKTCVTLPLSLRIIVQMPTCWSFMSFSNKSFHFIKNK